MTICETYTGGSKDVFYRQCNVRRPSSSDHGWVLTTTWLPEKYAVVGKYLRLKNKHGNWENHWQVLSAGERKTEQYVFACERDFLNQRSASDV